MSSEDPIYISSSEEDPEEYEEDPEEEPEEAYEGEHSDGEAFMIPAPESPPVAEAVYSEDSSIELPPPPPTTATARPPRVEVEHTWQLFSQFPPMPPRPPMPQMPPMRRTPRMCVRDFPVGPLAPRDKAPMHVRDESRDEPPAKRLRPAHLDYMPSTLRHWRSVEGIPPTFEIGESSSSAAPAPITGEPLELTVPTLVAVTRSLFGLHNNMQRGIRELESDSSRLDGDVAELYRQTYALKTQTGAIRESYDVLRARMDDMQREAAISRVIAGVNVVFAVLMTAFGFYLSYF